MSDCDTAAQVSQVIALTDQTVAARNNACLKEVASNSLLPAHALKTPPPTTFLTMWLQPFQETSLLCTRAANTTTATTEDTTCSYCAVQGQWPQRLVPWTATDTQTLDVPFCFFHCLLITKPFQHGGTPQKKGDSPLCCKCGSRQCSWAQMQLPLEAFPIVSLGLGIGCSFALQSISCVIQISKEASLIKSKLESKGWVKLQLGAAPNSDPDGIACSGHAAPAREPRPLKEVGEVSRMLIMPTMKLPQLLSPG